MSATMLMSAAMPSFRPSEGKLGTDESVFNKHFVALSPMELACVAQHYHKLTGHTILQAIDKEFHGDSKKAFRTIVYATLSPSEYFATRVKDAIKGFGTKDTLLIRVLVSRDEIDMPQIKQYYKQLYGKDMIEDIKSDIHGDSKKALRTIVYATLSPSEYFATRVKDAIKGFGTKDTLLIRILTSRDEIDMPQIKQYYKQLYGKDMIEDIKDDIKGDYQKLMVELCSH